MKKTTRLKYSALMLSIASANGVAVPVIVIKAIAEVETLGEGYLPNGNPLPKYS